MPARSQRTLALWRMTYVLPSCLSPKYITGLACGAIDECIRMYKNVQDNKLIYLTNLFM